MTALDEHFVPDVPNGTNGELAGPGFDIKSGVFSCALTSIIVRDVGVVDLALGDTFLVCLVIGLPSCAVAYQRRTLLQHFVPKLTRFADTLIALASGLIESRHLGRAVAAIVGRDIAYARFTLALALPSGEVVEL